MLVLTLNICKQYLLGFQEARLQSHRRSLEAAEQRVAAIGFLFAAAGLAE